MKILFDGKEVGSVLTNNSIANEYALCVTFGLSEIDNQEELADLYQKNNDFINFEDGVYFLVAEDFKFIY